MKISLVSTVFCLLCILAIMDQGLGDVIRTCIKCAEYANHPSLPLCTNETKSYYEQSECPDDRPCGWFKNTKNESWYDCAETYGKLTQEDGTWVWGCYSDDCKENPPPHATTSKPSTSTKLSSSWTFLMGIILTSMGWLLH